MGVYLRDNMGCMTDFGYVILETNLLMFMTIQACSTAVHVVRYRHASELLLKGLSDGSLCMWNTAVVGS